MKYLVIVIAVCFYDMEVQAQVSHGNVLGSALLSAYSMGMERTFLQNSLPESQTSYQNSNWEVGPALSYALQKDFTGGIWYTYGEGKYRSLDKASNQSSSQLSFSHRAGVNLTKYFACASSLYFTLGVAAGGGKSTGISKADFITFTDRIRYENRSINCRTSFGFAWALNNRWLLGAAFGFLNAYANKFTQNGTDSNTGGTQSETRGLQMNLSSVQIGLTTVIFKSE